MNVTSSLAAAAPGCCRSATSTRPCTFSRSSPARSGSRRDWWSCPGGGAQAAAVARPTVSPWLCYADLGGRGLRVRLLRPRRRQRPGTAVPAERRARTSRIWTCVAWEAGDALPRFSAACSGSRLNERVASDATTDRTRRLPENSSSFSLVGRVCRAGTGGPCGSAVDISDRRSGSRIGRLARSR